VAFAAASRRPAPHSSVLSEVHISERRNNIDPIEAEFGRHVEVDFLKVMTVKCAVLRK
jgi:hypothetical protein